MGVESVFSRSGSPKMLKSVGSGVGFLPIFDAKGGAVSESQQTALFEAGSTQKIVSLLSLVLQNTMLIIFMKYTRARTDIPMYTPSSAVVMNEVLKLILCVGILLSKMPCGKALRALVHHSIGSPKECLKVGILALLYTAQNNLGYLAVSNLQPATYQLLAQMKILATAIFAVLILKKQLSTVQWGSLVLLVAGVCLVQLSGGFSTAGLNENNMTGVAATVAICVLSGLAAVLFELMLKSSPTSIWIRNIQLAAISLVFGMVNYNFQTVGTAAPDFFLGYDYLVYLVISLQAGGGLIVAAVMKYADNILKCFATSISVVLSCLVSVFAFDFKITWMFCLGALMVLFSTYTYNNHESFSVCSVVLVPIESSSQHSKSEN